MIPENLKNNGDEIYMLLDKDLDWVHTTFFPNYDMLNEWTIDCIWHNDKVSGGMNYNQKKIYVHTFMLALNDGELKHLSLVQSMIIHEFVHAVLSRRWNHGRLFVEILSDCAVRAEQLHMTDLAEDLWLDVFKLVLEKRPIASTKVFYLKIKQMLQENPKSTLMDIIYDIFELIETSMDVNRDLGDIARKRICNICKDAYDVEKGKRLNNKRYFFINKN